MAQFLIFLIASLQIPKISVKKEIGPGYDEIRQTLDTAWLTKELWDAKHE